MAIAKAQISTPSSPDPRLERFLNERETIELAGFGSRSSFRKEVGARRFPSPVRISPGRIAWVESEVIAWQTSKIAERNETIRVARNPTRLNLRVSPPQDKQGPRR